MPRGDPKQKLGKLFKSVADEKRLGRERERNAQAQGKTLRQEV